MAHGVGKAIQRGFGFREGESGWYLGDYRGSDHIAKETLGTHGEMKTDLGGATPSDINSIIAQYEKGGELPEGRLGDIIRLSEEMESAIGGEYDIKEEMAEGNIDLANFAVDTAKSQVELMKGKKGDIENWLSGNLYNIERGAEKQAQKTGFLGGPSRDANFSKEQIRKTSDAKFDEHSIQMDLADIGVDKARVGASQAGSAKDLLAYDESKAMIKNEQGRLNQINQIKDLLYELETQALQFS